MEFTYISKESSNIAKRGISECIKQYNRYIKQLGMSESTANKYNSIIKLVVGDFLIPISQITTKQLNDYIAELYYEKKWSEKYTITVISVVTKFFAWCKDKNYTMLSHVLINPINGDKPIVNTNITPKETFVSAKTDNTPKPKINLVEENITTKANYTNTISITARDVAILYIIQHTTITKEELIDLTIYDFLHNKIVIQSINNRNNMRIVAIDTKTRNLIYNYLSTRSDNNEALFLSEKHIGEKITIAEVRKICK